MARSLYRSARRVSARSVSCKLGNFFSFLALLTTQKTFVNINHQRIEFDSDVAIYVVFLLSLWRVKRPLWGGRETAANKPNSLRGMKRLCQRSLSPERPAGRHHGMVRRCLGRSPGLTDGTHTHWSKMIQGLSAEAWLGKEGEHCTVADGSAHSTPPPPITEVLPPLRKSIAAHPWLSVSK